MTKLATALAQKKYPKTAKMMIVLDSLGGTAATGAIKTVAKANGAKGTDKWNVAACLGQASERVTKLSAGWLLLDAGRQYLVGYGYQPTSAAVDVGVPSAATRSASDELAIAIGHGHSKVWKELKEFLADNYDAKVIEFNSAPAVGLANKERLEQMLAEASLAFLVMTAEDQGADGKRYPRLNVVHEAGLFQGRLGFDKAAILLEDGCEEFSNMVGLGQIRFKNGDISSAFEEIRRYLKSAMP